MYKMLLFLIIILIIGYVYIICFVIDAVSVMYYL
jgi:hypothetical protein